MKEQAALERPLPFNAAAERCILGAILLNNEYLSQAAEILQPEDFFLESHRRLFAAMLLMGSESRAIDLVTMTDEMNRRGQLETVGGPAYIAQLVDGIPRLVNVPHYAEIVKEKSNLRQVAYLSHAAEGQALEGEESSVSIIDRAENVLAEIRQSSAKDAAPVSIYDAVQEIYPVLERITNGQHAIMGTPTGYPRLDQKTAGWMPGDLVIVGGRPSMGKTALCLEFAKHVAKRGEAVVIFSLEMSRASLVMRLASVVGRVDCHKLRSSYYERDDLRKLTLALNEIANWKLWIIDPPTMQSRDLVHRARYLAEQHKVRLVVVDYLQLLHAYGTNRTEQVGRVSQDLKEAAKSLGKISGGTLIAASQLTRVAAKDKPRLEDLRESGAIEQDADLVLFLSNKKGEGHAKSLDIAKQRNGPLGEIGMVFLPQYTAFEEEYLDPRAKKEN